ncbi:hypothetical protein COO60DRAFT_516585 [Scenedesmus sp. NREL 46B-D3]|nr:hypothetical protein COO60DRAFT_516585 [Scenedesmus sp. NREL 46B-D3]
MFKWLHAQDCKLRLIQHAACHACQEVVLQGSIRMVARHELRALFRIFTSICHTVPTITAVNLGIRHRLLGRRVMPTHHTCCVHVGMLRVHAMQCGACQENKNAALVACHACKNSSCIVWAQAACGCVDAWPICLSWLLVEVVRYLQADSYCLVSIVWLWCMAWYCIMQQGMWLCLVVACPLVSLSSPEHDDAVELLCLKGQAGLSVTASCAVAVVTESMCYTTTAHS